MLTHRRSYKRAVPALMITEHRICTITSIYGPEHGEKRRHGVIGYDIIPTKQQKVGMHIGKGSHEFTKPLGIEEAGIMDIGDKCHPTTVELGR